jgi:hypothetical protein
MSRFADNIEPYIERAAAQRALQLSEDEWLENASTVSLETQEDLVEGDILVFVRENFASFIKAVRFLSKDDTELLLSYYVLGKSQNVIAPLFQTTQTICSVRLRQAVQRLGAILMFGTPTQEVMAEILTKAGLEETEWAGGYCKSKIKMLLSKVIAAYAQTRNFSTVANAYRIHRPAIRRTLSETSKKLRASNDSREVALGSYIHGLVDKANTKETGLTKRQLNKQTNVYRRDPAILGEFRVSVDDPNFEHVFTAKANN